MAFILVIAMFVQLVEIVMKKMMPPLYKALAFICLLSQPTVQFSVLLSET